MNFSAKDVKELREVTGAGMMACKQALSECDGDREKAIDFLRAKGLAAAAKKQSRVAAEGLIGTAINAAQTGAIVEVNCETDFVAKNEDFQKFVSDLTNLVANSDVKTDEDVLNLTLNGKVVNDVISELTLKIGEKIAYRRFAKFHNAGNGVVGSYSHNGKIGVLVNVNTGSDVSTNSDLQEFTKDVCMHIAASDTRFLDESEMDEEFKNREAEVYAAQLKEQGKPENMIPNIVKGKLNKLASEVCLNQQKFVKDPDISVSQLAKQTADKIGTSVEIAGFKKFVLGEGIEKKEDNLADEVAKMTGQN